MKKILIILALLVGVLFFNHNSLASDPTQGISISANESEKTEVLPIPDPLQGMNQAFYKFNDKMYFWVLKPVAQGYGKILPRPARLSVQDFFTNIYAPVRMVNCGLQCDYKKGSIEASRFGINTTLGLVGFFDPAKNWFKLNPPSEEDFGQTLGCYKGPGFYLNLPFAGSTSLRDGIGSLVDMCIVPSWWVLTHYPAAYYATGATILEVVNRTSLRIGEYEEFKRAALDPYIAIRDAYNQHREDAITK
ncbi:MAG: VacJ family lipoprotein [Thermodesulfobacteriota bacterium]|jgi:phospholipid-binding lipoprotein MlaA|nr:MAG: VacJ family lipoprotein [Thermodesulfobacteriota bacterium]